MKIYAIKANRMVEIAEDEKQKYQIQGYQIAQGGDSGIRYEVPETPETKRIAELEEENAALRKKIAVYESEESAEPEKKPPTKGRGK